jgi:NADH-ubiquinone oxidoreductase chain 2
MLIIGIFINILAIGLFKKHISFVFWNRISFLILLFSCLLSFNSYFIFMFNTGISLYNGLWLFTTINGGFSIFIYIAGACILMLGEGFIKKESKTKKIYSSNFKSQKTLIEFFMSEYPLIILFTTLGMICLITSNDLISFFLGIELQSLSLYILATIFRESESSTSAGLKYFLLGALSSGLLLLGSCFLYGLTGLTNFESLYMISSFFPAAQYSILQLSFFILGIGLLLKIAAVPFHNWVIDVLDGVPTIVTTWIAIMPKISIIIFILNLQGLNSFNYWFSSATLLLICALFSLIIGSIGSLTQRRIKRLLAYSSITHIGFMLIALAINDNASIEALLFYMIQYFFTSINIFFIIIAFGFSMPSSNLSSIYSPILLISQLKGQFYNWPLLSLCFSICLFSMAGIPPLIGFIAKAKILLTVIDNGFYFIAIVIIFTSVISVAYYLRIIKVIHFDSSLVPSYQISNHTILSSSLSFIIATITLFIILFLINPITLLNYVHLLSLSLCHI